MIENLKKQKETASKLLEEVEMQGEAIQTAMQEFEDSSIINEDEKSKIRLFHAKMSRVINLAKKGDGSHIEAMNELIKEYGSCNKK